MSAVSFRDSKKKISGSAVECGIANILILYLILYRGSLYNKIHGFSAFV